MTRDVYIDANIFVTIFLERKGHEKIRRFFEEKAVELDLRFCTSEWTLTEIVKVLVGVYNVDSERVARYVEELIRGKRICGMKFYFVEVSPVEGYDFQEFFYDVQKTVLEYRNGVPDAIHSQIMRNNGIDMILTGDAGFLGVEGVEVLNPLRG